MRIAHVLSLARTYWRVLAALAAVPCLLGLWILWDASSAVHEARISTADAADAVDVRPLAPPDLSATREIGAPSDFRDAAHFGDRLFVAGAHGVVEYDERGVAVRRFRTGLELPPTPIVGVSVGALASSGRQELVLATAADGLVTFDGTSLRHLQPVQPDHRRITDTLWLGAGRMLIGTERAGALVYDGDRRLEMAPPALADTAVTALAGGEGDVWVGTLDRGVLRWRGGSVERFDESAGLPDRRVLSLAVAAGRAYVGTALGIAEIDDSGVTRTLGEGLFASAMAVQGDTLVVGTLEGTIARIPLSIRASRGVRPVEQPAPDPVRRFVSVADTLYAVTQNGVYAVDASGGFRQAVGGDPGQLTDRNVSALALDQLGRLWVGYFDKGLDVLSPDGARLVHVENDHVFCVNRIVHDPDGGHTAVATANGLALFDGAGRQRQLLGREDGLIASHVTDLLLRRGGMTVATPAGLTFLDERGNRSLYAFHGLVSNHVYALGAAGDTVVAGTLGGVSVLEGEAVHASYTAGNSNLPHNWITAIVPVDDHWFAGTYGGGVVRLGRDGRPERFPDLPDGIEINPNAMAVTPAHVFAGTLSEGLLVYDRATGRWTTFDRGLPSLNVTALAPGPDALYVGTDNGIVHIGYTVLERQ